MQDAGDGGGFTPLDLTELSGWVMATLAAGVATLFRLLQSAQAKQLDELKSRCDLSDQRHRDCEEDRDKLNERAWELTKRVEALEKK